MKHTRRILPILLALALGLAPAAAAANTKPVFTRRMPGATMTKTGADVTLSAQAKLPAGVDAALQYQWYASEWFAEKNMPKKAADIAYLPIEGATGPQVTVSCDLEDTGPGVFPLRVRAYRLQAYYVSGDGSVVSENDYTAVTCYIALEDYYRAIVKGASLDLDVPEYFVKVVAYPFLIPIFLLGWFSAGAIKVITSVVGVFTK